MIPAATNRQAGRTYVPDLENLYSPSARGFGVDPGAVPQGLLSSTAIPAAASNANAPTDWDYARGGLRVAGLLFPPAKMLSTGIDLLGGAERGFDRAFYGERPEEKKPQLLGKDLGGLGRLADRALFGREGIASFIGDKAGWVAGSLASLLGGGSEKMVPPSFAGPQQGLLSQPSPQPPTSQPVASSRPLQPATIAPQPMTQAQRDRIMTDAEKSLLNAYSHKNTYNPETGRYTSEPVGPQPTSPPAPYFNDNSLATLAQLGGSAGDVANWLSQGNYSLMPAQGGLNFGMSRFSTLDHGGAFNPSTMPGYWSHDPLFGQGLNIGNPGGAYRTNNTD